MNRGAGAGGDAFRRCTGGFLVVENKTGGTGTIGVGYVGALGAGRLHAARRFAVRRAEFAFHAAAL